MNRKLLRISGADAFGFLEGLVSNAVSKIDAGPVYSALLSPQGKYLFDFILSKDDDSILLDVAAERSEALKMRLNMYRLRADVSIEDCDLKVVQGSGDMPDGAFLDPRSDELGWRMYVNPEEQIDFETMDQAEWDALRVKHCVPESGIELVVDDSYILESGFERLNGVDFKKGCYVGQEVTARMKHKTELKKGLVRVSVQGDVPEVGTPILSDGKTAGVLFTTSNNEGIAYLRFDRANDKMTANDAVINRI